MENKDDIDSALARVTAWANGYDGADFDRWDVLVVVTALRAARRAAAAPGEPELAAIRLREGMRRVLLRVRGVFGSTNTERSCLDDVEGVARECLGESP